MSATSNNLQGVRRRIAAAVEAAQREPASVSLIAVSKTFPAEAVADAIDDDQQQFGENYVQEAIDKMSRVAALRPGSAASTTWHFIGPIQSNKTRAIAARFDWVHSIDRLKIAERLSAQRDAGQAPLNVLIEVNLDDEANKSGVAPDAAAALATAIVALPRLAFRGLMAVPMARDSTAAQRAGFARLRRVADDLRAAGLPCDHLSMGMSGDLEAAIAEGATMVRVGTAIFGARHPASPAVTV